MKGCRRIEFWFAGGKWVAGVRGFARRRWGRGLGFFRRVWAELCEVIGDRVSGAGSKMGLQVIRFRVRGFGNKGFKGFGLCGRDEIRTRKKKPSRTQWKNARALMP